jgi:hypothetical protein
MAVYKVSIHFASFLISNMLAEKPPPKSPFHMEHVFL